MDSGKVNKLEERKKSLQVCSKTSGSLWLKDSLRDWLETSVSINNDVPYL
jgi:hypothetical protein